MKGEWEDFGVKLNGLVQTELGKTSLSMAELGERVDIDQGNFLKMCDKFEAAKHKRLKYISAHTSSMQNLHLNQQQMM